MVTTEEVLEVLRRVMDPELGLDIVTLQMVKEVKLEGEKVRVTIALTSKTCPLAEKIRKDAEDELIKEGINATVELTVMSGEEMAQMMEALASRGGEPGAQPVRAPTVPPPGRLPKMKIKEIIAILSGKGGVGKSSVAAMLAAELVRRGKKVGLLDADITGPSIPKMLGLTEAPFVLEGKILPVPSKTGIRVMSMNLIAGKEEAPIVWRGPLVSSAIRQFYIDVDWGELDYLVLDLPPGTSDAQLTVMQLIPVDGIVVITSPQELAGMIVSKAVNMATMMNTPVLGIIENMSYVKCPTDGTIINVFGEPKGKKFAENINAKFLGSLPLDPEISKAADTGKIEDYQSPEFKAVVDRLLE